MFAACLINKHALAQAQYVPPPTPLPPPVFNPSTPYTVPQPPYTPIAPSTPSVSPGYVVTVPSERLPRAAVRSQHRTSAAKSAATARAARHRRHALGVRATPPAYSYYYSAFGYGYGCAWRRGWDGYWFRTPPCS